MASLGQELKRQRESRNISLEEMASSTKIVGRYLEALEQDKFDAMPGGFFVKGILRTYARYVGLDEGEVLEKYREAGVLDEPAKARSAWPDSSPAFPDKPRPTVWVLVIAAIIIFVVALIFLGRSRRPRVSAPSPLTTKTLPQAQAISPPPAEKPPAEPVKEEKEEWKGLTMDITFQEETWIQLHTDGALKIHGLYQPGEKVRAQADKEILIDVLGNAGGLTFLLNGKPGKILGRTGEVLNNVRINLENQKDFLQSKGPTGPPN
jgi:cytoskeletal protein RodZ